MLMGFQTVYCVFLIVVSSIEGIFALTNAFKISRIIFSIKVKLVIDSKYNSYHVGSSSPLNFPILNTTKSHTVG